MSIVPLLELDEIGTKKKLRERSYVSVSSYFVCHAPLVRFPSSSVHLTHEIVRKNELIGVIAFLVSIQIATITAVEIYHLQCSFETIGSTDNPDPTVDWEFLAYHQL